MGGRPLTVRTVALLALGAGSFADVSAAKAATPPNTIRVGGPSAPADSKVAIVGSARRLAGRPFAVVDASGRRVLKGKLRKARGSAAPWRHAATADLSAVEGPGSYRVVVGRLRSRAWKVRATGSTPTIPVLLRFFAANSDGNEPSPLHGPAHLNDATIASGPYEGRRFDLTGGWMDAGDTLHFTKTTAFAATILQLAARLDPAHSARLQAASDVGIRWLVKAHPAPDLFIQQIGDERDHDRGFAPPARDDASSRPGIGRRLAYPGIGSDVGGKAATALAIAAARASGPARDTLITQAREWYEAGERTDRIAPEPPGLVGDYFYGSDGEDGEGNDDLGTAAVMLWRATADPVYLSDARDWLNEIAARPPSWANTGALGFADLCGALGQPAVPDAAIRDFACAKLRAGGRGVERIARRQAFPVYGEFGFGTTGESGGGAALAGLAARAGVFAAGAALADGGRDWLLGRNQWGASFVVGHGPSAARHPHHWASLQGAGRPVGAVVGGPTTRAIIREQRSGFRFRSRSPFNGRIVYEDNVENYVTSEVSLDYTAGTLFNLAVAAP